MGGGGVGGAVAESELREADGEEQSQAAGASTGDGELSRGNMQHLPGTNNAAL